MLLSDRQMDQLVEQLLERTKVRKLGWYSDEGKFVVNLTNRSTISLARDQTGRGIDLAVTDPSDVVVGRATADGARATTPSFDKLSALDAAVREVAGGSYFDELMDAIQLTDSTAVAVAPTLPKLGPTPDQVSEILHLMAGTWNLDYSMGKEQAIIGGDGEYRIVGDTKQFKLTIRAWNPVTREVEVVKEKPDGRRWDVEVLKIESQQMRGYGKYDGNSLIYQRTAPSHQTN